MVNKDYHNESVRGGTVQMREKVSLVGLNDVHLKEYYLNLCGQNVLGRMPFIHIVTIRIVYCKFCQKFHNMQIELIHRTEVFGA